MILGIDPGVRKCGYALIQDDMKIVDAGILLLEKKTGIPMERVDYYQRILQLYEFFEKLVEQYPIEKIGIEQLFFTKFNQSNAEFVYGIRGALMMLFTKKKLVLKEFTPIQLKKYITGTGKAEKILVQQMIMKMFKLTNLPKYNDTADALGLAYLALKIK